METADGSSRDIAHGLSAVSVPLRDGMDAGCCRLLLLTNTLPHVQGAEYFYACAQVSLEVRLKCCQPQLAVDIEYRI